MILNGSGLYSLSCVLFFVCSPVFSLASMASKITILFLLLTSRNLSVHNHSYSLVHCYDTNYQITLDPKL